MKILPIIIFFLFCSAFTLAADEGTSVYIQPVSGGTRENNQYITNLLTVEIKAYNFTMADTSSAADYSFVTVLIPEASQPRGNPAGIYNLRITLRDNRTRVIISEQYMLFSASNRETLNNNLQFLIMRMIAAIAPSAITPSSSFDARTVPSEDVLRDIVREAVSEAIAAKVPPEEPVEKEEDEIDPEKWRNGLLFVSGFAAWAPRAYVGEHQSVFFQNVCAGVVAEVHFLNRFSFDAGISVTADWIVLDSVGMNNYRELLFEIPVSFKFAFKPSDHFMLQPYAGLILNLAFYGTIKPPPVSWMAGFQYGVRAGPGIFFIDPRISMDITKTRLNEIYGYTLEFDRIKMYIGFGYKFGFF